MPIELTRTHFVFAAVVVCAMLFLFSPSGSPRVISSWSPQAVVSSAPQGITGAARSVVGSVPLTLAGDVGFNVSSALNANGGALRHVVIPPGQTWSFNATVGNPATVPIRTVGGVPGGGWCDLASRYVQAVRPLLATADVRFVNHVTSSGIRIADVADADAVSIWNINGQAGSSGQSQDLEITNSLSVPITFQVIEQAGQQVLVEATLGQ